MDNGLFFTNDTLQAFVNLVKANGIPTLTSPVRVWELESGVYRIPQNCSINYNGATGSGTYVIKIETFMIVSGENTDGKKTFYIFNSPNGNTRQILSGYTDSTSGAVTGFNINTSYALASSVLSKTNTTAYTPTASTHPATKGYVDDSIKNISNGGGGVSTIQITRTFTSNPYTISSTEKEKFKDYCISIIGGGFTPLLLKVVENPGDLQNEEYIFNEHNAFYLFAEENSWSGKINFTTSTGETIEISWGMINNTFTMLNINSKNVLN